MKINRLKSKLKLFYTIFIAPPKEWHLPKKSEVLIYDACGAEALAPYLTKYKGILQERKFKKILGAQCDVLVVDESDIEYIMNCIPEKYNRLPSREKKTTSPEPYREACSSSF